MLTALFIKRMERKTNNQKIEKPK